MKDLFLTLNDISRVLNFFGGGEKFLLTKILCGELNDFLGDLKNFLGT